MSMLLMLSAVWAVLSVPTPLIAAAVKLLIPPQTAKPAVPLQVSTLEQSAPTEKKRAAAALTVINTCEHLVSLVATAGLVLS
jgi:hypothetical protein